VFFFSFGQQSWKENAIDINITINNSLLHIYKLKIPGIMTFYFTHIDLTAKS
jgi:hypothetical protein